MARQVPLMTRDESLLSQTIRDIMDDQALSYPLGTTNLFMAMERLHFPTHLYFDKIYGHWCFSNLPPDMWPLNYKDQLNGANFTIFDLTAEMAIARGIHYYFHLKIKS